MCIVVFSDSIPSGPREALEKEKFVLQGGEGTAWCGGHYMIYIS
jgi:hypothetical protein